MKTSGLQLDTNNVFHNASVIEYTDQGHYREADCRLSEKFHAVYGLEHSISVIKRTLLHATRIPSTFTLLRTS